LCIDGLEKAAQLLAVGMKVKDVAENISVNRATIWHWKNDPNFIAHMNNLRNEYRDSCRSAIWSLHSEPGGGHKTSHLGYLGHSLPVLGGEFGYKIPIYRREANCVDLKVGQLCTNLHNPGI